MGEVTCELCPRGCVIPEGASGDCRIRVNIDGKLVATTYGRPSSIHIDPIEKKPLNHFRPATPVFSIATAGCNLHCLNCQNWQLSQSGGEDMETIYRLEPARVVSLARLQGCQSIAYTYSDPIVFYEYVYDTSVLAREAGMTNVFVTAGYINKKPLKKLCKVLDASNTDLKAFDDGFYRKVSSATLQPVLDALVIQREEGVWLEVTNLVIPTLNDDLAMIRRMSKWIRDNLGEDTPLHFSGFTPMYRMRNLPHTPATILEQARNEALDAGLHYVYIGNVHSKDGSNTYCPRDGTLLIRRTGFHVDEYNLSKDGRCPVCRETIPGVWR
jgi:pyruvate formate lyase activating enzyme